MTKPSTRRKRFLAALALEGMDQRDFAAVAGVSAGHLSLVLSGKRESGSLVDKIDAFTERTLPQQKIGAAVEVSA